MSIFKSKTSDIELVACPQEDEDHDYVCFECLLANSENSIDGNRWLRNCIDAIDHINEHIAAGHLVPNEAIDWIQRCIVNRSLVHQSCMSATRRFDGSFSAFCEDVFYRQWIKENERNINASLLQNLIHGAGIGEVSHRDARVAATIITWLGTNVGRCFVENCQRQIATYDKHKNVGKNEKNGLTPGNDRATEGQRHYAKQFTTSRKLNKPHRDNGILSRRESAFRPSTCQQRRDHAQSVAARLAFVCSMTSKSLAVLSVISAENLQTESL